MTVWQHAQHRDPDTETATRNSVIVKLILLSTPVLLLLRTSASDLRDRERDLRFYWICALTLRTHATMKMVVKLFFQTHWVVSSQIRLHFGSGQVQNPPWDVDTELLSKYQTAEPNYTMQPPSGASI